MFVFLSPHWPGCMRVSRIAQPENLWKQGKPIVAIVAVGISLIFDPYGHCSLQILLITWQVWAHLPQLSSQTSSFLVSWAFSSFKRSRTMDGCRLMDPKSLQHALAHWFNWWRLWRRMWLDTGSSICSMWPHLLQAIVSSHRGTMPGFRHRTWTVGHQRI